MNVTHDHILQKYCVSPDARLSSGMEAETYTYGSDAVLKLYAGTTSLDNLLILQQFYERLNHDLVPFALPRIHTVAQEDGFIITIEQRLIGTPLSTVIPMLTTEQLDTIMQRYLSAQLALSHVQAPPKLDRYKLFDPDHVSDRSNGDWYQFLTRYLTYKLDQVNQYLSRDVPNFAARVQELCTLLKQPYLGDYRLIHGDFFPGNLLTNDDLQITALLDFGLLTMYGDYLFDIATGWVFFDMYDELKAQIRERYMALLVERLGRQVRGKLYRYVLIYSIISANTYSWNCRDGHYQWCVTNLSNQHYWDTLE